MTVLPAPTYIFCKCHSAAVTPGSPGEDSLKDGLPAQKEKHHESRIVLSPKGTFYPYTEQMTTKRQQAGLPPRWRVRLEVWELEAHLAPSSSPVAVTPPP